VRASVAIPEVGLTEPLGRVLAENIATNQSSGGEQLVRQTNDSIQ
jgi:hypothetical protein